MLSVAAWTQTGAWTPGLPFRRAAVAQQLLHRSPAGRRRRGTREHPPGSLQQHHGHRGPPRPDVTTIETRHERPPIHQMLDGAQFAGQRPPSKGRDRRDEQAPQQTQEEEGPERAAHDVGEGPS